MIVIACPSCSDEVTVPSGASPEATVRCPLCQEEYLLADALSNIPPTLEVVGGGGGGGYGAGAFGGGQQQSSIGSSDGGGVATEAKPPAFQFDQQSAPSAAGTASRPAPRPRRKQKKPAVEIVKVVVGGVVGIGLAIYLIWWFGKDPFKIAPKVNEFAPWLVPDKVIKDKDDDEEKTDEGGDSKTGQTAQNPWQRETKTKDSPEVAEVADPDLPIRDGTLASDPMAEPADDDFDPEAPQVNLTFTWVELKDQVIATSNALNSWNLERGSEDKKNKFFAGVEQLGVVVTFLENQADPQNENGLNATMFLLQELSKTPENLEALNQRAVSQLDDKSTSHFGTVFSGTVTEVKKLGDFCECRVALTDNPDVVVPLFSGTDLSNTQDREILVLGTVVNDPATNFPKYPGSSEQVVFCGWFVIPDASPTPTTDTPESS